LLHLHAVNAKEEITRRQKINGQHLISWSLVNTVDSAESILCIKRPNKELCSATTTFITNHIVSFLTCLFGYYVSVAGYELRVLNPDEYFD